MSVGTSGCEIAAIYPLLGYFPPSGFESRKGVWFRADPDRQCMGSWDVATGTHDARTVTSFGFCKRCSA
jgi:hypothetical protein